MRFIRYSLYCYLAFFLLTLCPDYSYALGSVNNQAAVVGKVMYYDQSSDTFTVYGRRSVLTNKGWQIVETQKFYHVLTNKTNVHGQLKARLGKGVKVFGIFQTVQGTREQNLIAEKVTIYDPETDRVVGQAAAYGPAEGPFDWTGFGVSVYATQLAKADIEKVTDFVNLLAELRDVVHGGNGEESENEILPDKELPWLMEIRFGNKSPDERHGRIATWWRNKIQLQWLLEKDLQTLNECLNAVGGSAFYTGKLGKDTGLIETVPVNRRQIDNFMNNYRSSGGTILETTKGVFFAEVSAVTQNREKKLYANGPFFKTVPDLINGLKNLSGHSESWRLEGWEPSRAKVIEGKQCWISGTKVLVRDPLTGEIIDWYFSIDKSLTRGEFDSCLNFWREVAKKGGL